MNSAFILVALFFAQNLFAQSCSPAPSGLVSWWRGDGNALDIIGGNNGTLQNGALASAAGEVNQAFGMNGSNQCIQIPYSPSLITSNFTIETWIKPASQVSDSIDQDLIFGQTYGYGQLVVRKGAVGLVVALQIATSPSAFYTVESTNEISINQFSHLGGTWDGTTLKLYINGSLNNQITPGVAPVSSGCSFFIGGFYSPSADSCQYTGQFFNGIIDEVSLFGSALTAAQIQAIYTSSVSGKCLPPPAILTQPTTQSVYVGDTAMFMVTASGTQPLNYQWRVNTTILLGATNATLTLSNVQLSQAGNYSVVVSNQIGTMVSSNAALIVIPQCASVSSGLLAWWPGEGNALDAVGGNNGTLQNGATATIAGEVNHAFGVNGTNQCIQIPFSPSLITSNFTIETWIKPASQVSDSVNQDLIFGQTYGYGQLVVRKGNTGLVVALQIATSPSSFYSVVSTNQIPINQFSHLGGTWDGTTLKLYINGSLNNQITPGVAPVSSGCSFFIGGFYSPSADSCQYTGQFFNGIIDEVSLFGSALNASQLQAIYAASISGKCPTPIAPFVITQPTSRTVLAGTNTTFTVAAGGSQPLSYQWLFKSNSIPGATNSSLTLSNVQFNQNGSYSVTVSNAVDSVTSSNALLTVVHPAANVRVVSAAGLAGETVAVPVQLLANGNENALGFSLSFNTNFLAVSNIVAGSGAAGAALIVNSSQVANGRIGAAVALASSSTFAPGTQEVAVVNFTITASPFGSNRTASVTLGDVPTTRQLSDVNANALAANYASGAVTILAATWEGDTAPRTNGDKQLTITDWVQVGRFVAKLDVPAHGSEYQRADCAPRSTLGNGVLSVTDWVQAGLYAVGTDPLTVAGGPTSEVSSLTSLKAANPPPPQNNLLGRIVKVVSKTVQAADTNTVTVQLLADGTEGAIGFTLNFDPAMFHFVSASLGANAAGAQLNLNTNSVGTGKLGAALSQSPGTAFAAGTLELLKVNFAVNSSASGTSNVAFSSSLVAAEVSDATAHSLAATFADGTLTVSPFPPVLRADHNGDNVLVAWPAAAANFILQTNGADMGASNWNNSGMSPALVGEENVVTVTNTTDSQFFRLYHP